MHRERRVSGLRTIVSIEAANRTGSQSSQTIPAPGDGSWNRARRIGRDGNVHRHGLNQRNTEAFVQTGYREDIGKAVERLQLGIAHAAGQQNVTIEPVSANASPEGRIVFPQPRVDFTHQHKPAVRVVFPVVDIKRVDKVVIPLVRHDPPHHQDVDLAVAVGFQGPPVGFERLQPIDVVKGWHHHMRDLC